MYRVFALLFSLSFTTYCFGQPATPLVYINQVGGHENRFVLSTTGEVSGARYLFETGLPIQFDRLTFVRDVEFPDGRDNSPLVVRGWMYQGTDKSDVTWRIIFGKDENAIPGTYPIYYASETDDQFTRWQLPRGTTRRSSTFEDEILAILWANQVDVDRLGLQPFSKEEQLPLTVAFAWNAIRDELNHRLQKEGFSTDWALVRLPSGQFQVDLEHHGDGKPRELYRILRIVSDLEIRVLKEAVVEALTAADLSEEFFDGDAINFSRIASATRNFVESGSPQLRSMNLTTKDVVQAAMSRSLTTPWQPLLQGQNYHQFWRLEFRVERVTETINEQYAVQLRFVVGECPASKAQFGDRFIVAKYDSLDADSFSNLFVRTLPPGAPSQFYTRTVSISRTESIPPGVSIADPMDGITLKSLFDDTFQNYLARLKRK